MELTLVIFITLIIFLIIVGGIKLYKQPRAKKKVGGRHYYIKWYK